ncbi:hypothetical protein GCM10023079_10980 [Streptomyces chitinivorans]
MGHPDAVTPAGHGQADEGAGAKDEARRARTRPGPRPPRIPRTPYRPVGATSAVVCVRAPRAWTWERIQVRVGPL